MSAIDVDSLVAIDVHTHVEVSGVNGCGALSPELEEAANEYFGVVDRHRPPVGEMAEYYRERKMAAVVFTVDSRTTMGVPPVPIDEIAEGAAANADVLIAFGSVDPHMGRAAVREVERQADELARARASSSIRTRRRSTPTTRWRTRSTRRSPSAA